VVEAAEIRGIVNLHESLVDHSRRDLVFIAERSPDCPSWAKFGSARAQRKT
jgi:hypothetical protein